jgi:predicted HD superfamily hydrolase involved in NAD metabolism
VVTEFSALTIKQAKKWVKSRVSEKRFRHITGVAQTARKLAKKYGAEPGKAELAGWLHDACKEFKDKQLVQMANDYGLPLDKVYEENGHLLHGPIAAEVVKRELNFTDELVLNAIREHTLGAVAMTTLSVVVFLADAIEPGRSEDFTKPIWEALERAKEIGDAQALNLAVRVTCDMSLRDLLLQGRVIHPRTVEVRNYYTQLTRGLA